MALEKGQRAVVDRGLAEFPSHKIFTALSQSAQKGMAVTISLGGNATLGDTRLKDNSAPASIDFMAATMNVANSPAAPTSHQIANTASSPAKPTV